MIKKLIAAAAVICLLAGSSFGQQYRRYDAGFGLRLGDPFGLTYKYYMPYHRAFEVNFGTTAGSWYSGYYRNNFNNISEFDEYQYLGHSVRYALAVQGRLLFHEQFPERIAGLEWYYGFGAQLRIAGQEYDYRLPGNRIERDSRVDLGIGPDFILGAEYIIPDVPLTAFIDINLFVELIDNPFMFRFQGGIGVRYDFDLR